MAVKKAMGRPPKMNLTIIVKVADVFTDGSVDSATRKFVPRQKEDRLARLEQFLQTRDGFYSERSVNVLRYLAEHLQPASPRSPENPTDMSSTAMMHLTRGFAGAVTFEFHKDSDTVRMDFLPRVITTSTPTKTMMGQTLPTVIDRTTSPATEEDQRVMRAYHEKVIDILERVSPAE